MTTQQAEQPIDSPWTLGWRLRWALEHGDVSVDTMAAELSYGRSSLSRWMHDNGPEPRDIVLKQWALRCGVVFDWLKTGEGSPTPPQLPRLDSNQEPIGYRPAPLRLVNLPSQRKDLAA